MTTRGIRGTTTADLDKEEIVLSTTRELLTEIIASNPDLSTNDIASAIFTTTTDIESAFPALAARQIGWDKVPMICSHEIPVPGSLPRCIRVLILWNTNKEQSEIFHVYQRDAVTLRPDLVAHTNQRL